MKVLCPMLANSRTDTEVVRKVVVRTMVPMGGVSAPGLAAVSFMMISASPSESMSDHSWRPVADMGATVEKAIAGRGQGEVCGARGEKTKATGVVSQP